MQPVLLEYLPVAGRALANPLIKAGLGASLHTLSSETDYPQSLGVATVLELTDCPLT